MSRAALITGASRGIGRGIALALADAGFDIAAVGTTESDALNSLADEISARGRVCIRIAGNIAERDDRDAIVHSTLERFGRIDLLVNNAGVAPLDRRDILEMSEESYDRVMGINAKATVLLTQLVALEMVRVSREHPHKVAPAIVFITSISADTASPNRAEYCMSKAALSSAAQNFAVRLAEEGILVYEVRPGIIRTDMTAAVTEKYDRLIEQGVFPQGRWGTVEDVARVVTALASGQFAYSTGSVLEVAGGFGLKRL